MSEAEGLGRWVGLGIVAALFVPGAAIFSEAVGPESPPVAVGERDGPSGVDVHMHLDGVQAGEAASGATRGARSVTASPRAGVRRGGRGPKVGHAKSGNAGESSVDAMIALMDRLGVEKAVVMPPPQGPGQEGGYDFKSLAPLVARHRDRLALAGGGGSLNPMIVETDATRVTAEDRRRFEAAADEIIRAGASAFGEMTAMHFCLNPKHHYIAAPADHPLFLLLADIAARQNIPIDLHMEAIVEERETPPAILNACSKNPRALPATIPALERLLAHNRRAKIVWQHIGWDNTGEMTVSLLRRLLSDHPNLYLAIKAVEPRGREIFNTIIDASGNPREKWIELMEDYPERIVVGADEFVRGDVKGGYEKPPFFERTWEMVGRLPSPLAKKVGRDNALVIYGLE